MSAEMPHSDAAVTRATGKSWDEWRSLLDEWGAPDKSHKEIAAYLVDEHEIDAWWAQGVTVGYERAIGRRKVGQSNDGKFSASVSKTINSSAEHVYLALVDESQRDRWMDSCVVQFRTSTPNKSARFDDRQAGVIIAFYLSPKGDGKCSVQVQADRLPDEEAGEAWKSVWKPRLNALAQHVS